MRHLLLCLLLFTACDNTSLPSEMRKIEGHVYIKEWHHNPDCPKCKEKDD